MLCLRRLGWNDLFEILKIKNKKIFFGGKDTMANDVFSELKELFNIESNRTYYVPVFQREYSWKTNECEQLFDDIFDNDEGYFIGSVLLVKDTDNTLGDPYNIIDGQQRMSTISLLLNALYKKLSELDNSSEILGDIKRKLVKRVSGEFIPRLNLLDKDKLDYLEVIKMSGVYDFENERPKNWGNRKIARAWNSLLVKVDGFTTLSEVEQFYKKVNSCLYVQMIPNTTADAYVLFEALNNRGLPLSVIDLLKIDYFKQMNEKEAIKKWSLLLKTLGDDINFQTRFILALYSSIVYDHKDILIDTDANISMITKKKAIQNYKILFESITNIRDVMQKKALLYSKISGNKSFENQDITNLAKKLSDLDATQIYPLLLFIVDIEGISDKFIKEIFEGFIKFFIRRNVTNYPQAKTVRQYAENCIRMLSDKKDLSESVIRDSLRTEMFSKTAPDSLFEEELSGDIYTISRSTTRRILITIEEYKSKSKTKEYKEFEAKTNKDQWYWTIEHILPEGSNIKEWWIRELLGLSKDIIITDEVRKAAIEIQESNMHKLGNLTLTVYNSDVSDNSFIDKTKEYETKLWLNTNGVLEQEHWTENEITNRTNNLIGIAKTVFDLSNW